MHKLLALAIFASLLLSCSKSFHQQNEEYINFKNNGKHISIDVKINQYKKGNFYFDTGSPSLVLDSTFYKNQKMSFNNYSESNINGAGSSTVKMIRVLDSIKYSNNSHTFLSKNNLIYDLKNKFGKDVDGVIGILNFGNTPFKIDYSNQKISLNPKVDNSYQEITVKFDSNFIYLPMKLVLHNGATISGDFIIDTGSNKTVLTSEFANNKDFLNTKKVDYKNNGGIGGLHIGFSMFASEANLGKFHLIAPQIDVSFDTIGALSKNEKYIGIIGNDILKQFDIIYHPTQNKIWIRPNKNFNNPSDDLYKSFFPVEKQNPNKGWIVGSIYEDSDAYKQGLRHQDEIVEINNKSVKKIDREKFMRKLQPNQKLKLKIKRKNEYFEIDTYLNVFLKKTDK